MEQSRENKIQFIKVTKISWHLALINLFFFYGFVPCFVLGIDICPKINIHTWLFTDHTK